MAAAPAKPAAPAIPVSKKIKKFAVKAIGVIVLLFVIFLWLGSGGGTYIGFDRNMPKDSRGTFMGATPEQMAKYADVPLDADLRMKCIKSLTVAHFLPAQIATPIVTGSSTYKEVCEKVLKDHMLALPVSPFYLPLKADDVQMGTMCRFTTKIGKNNGFAYSRVWAATTSPDIRYLCEFADFEYHPGGNKVLVVHTRLYCQGQVFLTPNNTPANAPPSAFINILLPPDHPMDEIDVEVTLARMPPGSRVSDRNF